MPTLCSIILTGDALPGHQLEEVVVTLAKLLKTTEEKAAGLLSGRETVVKRNVSAGDVERYITALGQAGVGVRYEPLQAPPATTVSESNPAAVEQDAESGRPVPPAVPPIPAPVLAPAAPVRELAIEETVICPQCGHSQPKRTLCLNCSCDMPRMRAAKEQVQEKAKVDESAYWASPRARVEDVEHGEMTPPVFAMSTAGRLGRLRYLAFTWPLLAFAAIGGILAAIVMPRHPVLGGILLVPSIIVAGWMAIRLLVLRLHDVNRSGKWVLAFVLLSGAAGVMQSPALLIACSVVVWLATLAIMVWPGTDGENDYGSPCGPNTTWVKVGAGIFIAFQLLGLAGYASMMRSGKLDLSDAMGSHGAASHNAMKTTDPVYAEIRIERDVSGRQIEMAYFGKMDNESDCQEQASRFSNRMLANCEGCVAKTSECKTQLSPRYAMLFDDTPTSTTYLSMAKGSPSEREWRLVFWGLSVNESDMICDAVSNNMRKFQKGAVQCVRAKAS